MIQLPKINGVPVTPEQVLELAGLPTKPDGWGTWSDMFSDKQCDVLRNAGFSLSQIARHEAKLAPCFKHP